jgi:uncharacterized membrane protein
MSLKNRQTGLIDRLRSIVLNPSRLYLLIALPIVLGFVLFTPPFHGPDEDAHFTRAYSIASGMILPDKTSQGVGSFLPKEIGETINDSSYSPNIRGITSSKHNPLTTLREINDVVTKPTDERFYDTSATLTYNPLSYLPAIAGILPVNIFNGPPLFAMYLARVITALSTVLLFYLAIRLYPGRKIVPLLIFLLPMLLFQQSVISIDGISYALLAVFISMLARMYGRKNNSTSQWIGLGAVSLTLCFVKPLIFIFLPLALILLGKDRKSRIALLSMFVVCGLVLVAWFGFLSSRYEGAPQAQVATGAVPEQQVEYLKENPLRAVRVAWNTYTTTYADGQTRGLVGTFGSADALLPLWVIAIVIVATSLGVVFDSKSKQGYSRRLGWKSLLLVAVVAIVYFIGINASMYVAYTPVGFDIFYGVQGRYFIPILLLIPLVFLGRGIGLDPKDATGVRRWAIAAVIFCLAMSIFTILQRYYWYTP